MNLHLFGKQKMQDIQFFEKNLLLNTPVFPSCNTPLSHFEKILNGQYETVLDEFCKSFLLPVDENFELKVEEKIKAGVTNREEWCCMGIASFLFFIQNNWVGPVKKKGIDYLSILRKTAAIKLSLTEQINENIVNPELLLLAKIILSNKEIQSNFISTAWWLFRVNLIHQLVLDEASAIIFEETEQFLSKLYASNLMEDAALKTLLCTEVSQFYLYYNRVQSSEKNLNDAKITAKLNLELTGALGKRTKFQCTEKSQLYLTVQVKKDLFPFRKCDVVPKVINLSDDLLLENINFVDKKENFKLGSFEEAIIMTEFFQLQSSQPKDELSNEELIPYLNYIIENSNNWALKISALFQRSILESKHKRTMERAFTQMECLIENLCNSITPTAQKLDLFFASGMKPSWIFKHQLANLMLNLGMIKAALDLYLNLSLWEDVIVCYTILELNHKAAEIIRQQLKKKSTVKLWCLLGDMTQEVEHYETAWRLSNGKSSRAQRHWGFYYYSKQKYAEAVPHLKQSVELNNIQENVWLRLGFAALKIEDWNLAASAYRKYCALEQSSFEVWNNLAKAYIKLGDKSRAWRSLQDAIKCNFDKWEVWDNLMVVSTDLGNFSEVIRCYHRILDLKSVHVDIQVLSILSKAIVQNLEDSEGTPMRKYLPRTLELFGRLTAVVGTDSDIWRLYAELTLLKNTYLDNQKAAQYLQRAYGSAASNSGWFKTVAGANTVLETCLRLAEGTAIFLEKCDPNLKLAILGSAKMALQSVVKKIKDLMWEDQSGIAQNLDQVEQYLKKFQEKLEEKKMYNITGFKM